MLVEFENVTKFYKKKLIIDKVNFIIEPAEINVLIGPNGAGKSTIAKLLIGTESPSIGQIRKRKSLNIAYVPQGFKPNYEIPIKAKNYCNYLGIDHKSKLEGDVYNIDQIDEIWEMPLNNMSGGQLQSFLLATSFAMNPELLILDEPTTHLDIDSESKFYQILENQRKIRKMSIFIISHDLHSVMETADNVLCLNHHICCSGKPVSESKILKSNIGVYHHYHSDKHNHSNL